MSREPRDLEQILADKTRVEAAMRTAIQKALTLHKKAHNPIAVWRDGGVVWLRPEDIPEPEEEAT